MKKSVVEVTDDAMAWIADRCHGDSWLRVRINSKGCSGHQYEYDMVDHKSVGKYDEVISCHGGGLIIESSSVMHLLGAKLGVRRDSMQEHLHWENPHAVNLCGCGTSFSLS